MLILTDIQSDRLAKVCAQVNLTLADAELKFANLEYGPLMARLIDMRDAAAFTARKDDTVTKNQRTSLEAHLALATHRGDTALMAKLDTLLSDFDATYAKASQALDICTRTQGKPSSQFFAKRSSSNGTSNVSPATSVDLSGILADEAV